MTVLRLDEHPAARKAILDAYWTTGADLLQAITSVYYARDPLGELDAAKGFLRVYNRYKELERSAEPLFAETDESIHSQWWGNPHLRAFLADLEHRLRLHPGMPSQLRDRPYK